MSLDLVYTVQTPDSATRRRIVCNVPEASYDQATMETRWNPDDYSAGSFLRQSRSYGLYRSKGRIVKPKENTRPKASDGLAGARLFNAAHRLVSVRPSTTLLTATAVGTMMDRRPVESLLKSLTTRSFEQYVRAIFPTLDLPLASQSTGSLSSLGCAKVFPQGEVAIH